MRKIAWEKWVDFYDEDNEDDTLEDDDDNDEMMDHPMAEFKITPITVRTPLGPYNVYEPLLPSRMFDCWVGHTDFPIGHAEKEILDSIDGIEVLRIMTRYRFFIGIGKLFSLTTVRPLIELKFGISSESAIADIMRAISGKERWIVCLYASGLYDVSFPEDDEDLDSQIKMFECNENINIITSKED